MANWKQCRACNMKSLHRKALLGKFLEQIAILSARDGVSLFMPSPPRQQREKKRETMVDKTRDFLLCSVIHFLWFLSNLSLIVLVKLNRQSEFLLHHQYNRQLINRHRAHRKPYSSSSGFINRRSNHWQAQLLYLLPRWPSFGCTTWPDYARVFCLSLDLPPTQWATLLTSGEIFPGLVLRMPKMPTVEWFQLHFSVNWGRGHVKKY